MSRLCICRILNSVYSWCKCIDVLDTGKYFTSMNLLDREMGRFSASGWPYFIAQCWCHINVYNSEHEINVIIKLPHSSVISLILRLSVNPVKSLHLEIRPNTLKLCRAYAVHTIVYKPQSVIQPVILILIHVLHCCMTTCHFLCVVCYRSFWIRVHSGCLRPSDVAPLMLICK